MIALVEFGQRLSAATDGAFDLTVAPLVEAWGFGPSGPQEEPTEEELQTLLANVGYQQLEVAAEEHTLRKKKPGLKIDLGSLLQGYAADRLGALLDARGVKEYLIEVGGELKARGSWTVAIENPADVSQPLRKIELRDAALATSGVYRQAGHILDPHTGQPVAAKWQLVAVIRPTCLEADGWATALIAASESAIEIANREQIAALMQAADSRIETSAAAKDSFAPLATE
jgi:FAD:protein FMN transferase